MLRPSLSIAVMKHPKRDLPQMFLQRLGDLPVEIIDGSGLTLWRSAQAAWFAGRGEYHCVMHDDVMPCVGFPALATAFLKRHRATPVAFLSPISEGLPGGAVATNTFTMGGALCLPSALIVPFIVWCVHNIQPDWDMDDTRLTLWCCATGRKIYSPVPNLVQHVADSSIARPAGRCQRSTSYVEDPGPLDWAGETVHIPGNPNDFLVSRKMHFIGG